DGYASAGKAEGNYQGVGQQSGLFAGNGGYHVDAGHVNLVGGAIASTHAGNSELTAGSLTFTDLQNHMDYTASSEWWCGRADGWLGAQAGNCPICLSNNLNPFFRRTRKSELMTSHTNTIASHWILRIFSLILVQRS
ncbi:TPA: hypothetical protein ACKP8A_003618, partial [Stenotrophomonas maltophilia]